MFILDFLNFFNFAKPRIRKSVKNPHNVSRSTVTISVLFRRCNGAPMQCSKRRTIFYSRGLLSIDSRTIN